MSPRVFAVLAALALALVPAAHAATLSTVYPGAECVSSEKNPILYQVLVPTGCNQNVACNGTFAEGISASINCNYNGGSNFNLTGSAGTYFAISEFNGAGCKGQYVTAGVVVSGSCVSLGLLGIPAYGMATCGGNQTLKIYGNDKCTIPFTGVSEFVFTPGQCTGTFPNGGEGLSLTGACSNVTATSGLVPIPAVTAATTTTTAAATTSKPAGAMKTAAPLAGAAAAAALAAAALF